MRQDKCISGLIVVLMALSAIPRAGAEGAPALTLEAALDRANRESPILMGFAWELRAADARVDQAGLRLNPELTIDIEDVPLGSRRGATTRRRGISGSVLGGGPAVSWEREREDGGASVSDATLTVLLAQEIELGRKRARRVALAEKQRALRQWDYETARADVLADTARAFVATLTAQERLSLQRELLSFAATVERTISLRVDAGQVSPLERNRAEVARATTEIAVGLAEREERAARAALASHWAGLADDFGRLDGRLEDVAPIPGADTLLEAISSNPDIARWAAEMAERSAIVELERARRIPNMTVAMGLESAAVLESGSSRGFGLDSGGGYSAFRSTSSVDDRDYSVQLGFSIPLPFFNRNQGNIAAAGHLATKASEERRAAVAKASGAAIVAREAAVGALKEHDTLEADILTTAQETFDKTQTGYREGKFGYLDVLDAQRTLFEVRSAQLEALARHHQAMIDLERLTGPIPAATQKDTQNDHN